MKNLLLVFLLFLCSCQSNKEILVEYSPTEEEVKKAEAIAKEVAAKFEYTVGRMDRGNLGQCGDYALAFVLKFNEFVGKNVARLVVANNPIESGYYRVGEKVNVKDQGFDGFPSAGSGFLRWNGKIYLYHPIHGAYKIFLEKAWTPRKHFDVNMLDKSQVHVWASIGNISVDPTYYDSWPEVYSSPLGVDE